VSPIILFSIGTMAGITVHRLTFASVIIFLLSSAGLFSGKWITDVQSEDYVGFMKNCQPSKCSTTSSGKLEKHTLICSTSFRIYA